MLAPELLCFVGVTIDGQKRTLPGWEDVNVHTTIFTWRRKRDGLLLSEILAKDSVKDKTFEEKLQMIKEGKL
jgi:hypothetical protein